MLDLFLTGGQLVTAAAIGDVNMLGPEALRHTGRVHRDVSGADDGDAVKVLDGRVIIVTVGLHEVRTGQKLVGGIHAQEVLTRNVQELRQAGAGADEDRFKAVLKELVYRDGLADDGVVHDLDAHFGQVLNLRRDDFLRETELRNAVDQHAAGLVEGLENGHVIAHLAQVARAGQTRRAGTDDRDTVAVGFGGNRFGLVLLGHVIVRHKALKTADADSLALQAADALGLALLLLRTHTTADRRQRVGAGDDVIGRVKIAVADLLEEAGNLHANRAAGAAGAVFAVQAAGGFLHRGLCIISKSNFVEIPGADNRILLGHFVLCHAHIDLQISHFSFLL